MLAVGGWGMEMQMLKNENEMLQESKRNTTKTVPSYLLLQRIQPTLKLKFFNHGSLVSSWHSLWVYCDILDSMKLG